MSEKDQVVTPRFTVSETAVYFGSSTAEKYQVPIEDILEATRVWIVEATKQNWQLRTVSGAPFNSRHFLQHLSKALNDLLCGFDTEKLKDDARESYEKKMADLFNGPFDKVRFYREAVAEGFFCCMMMMGGDIKEGIEMFKETLEKQRKLSQGG